jgi:uncharacterized protein (TIGR00369 family)
VDRDGGMRADRDGQAQAGRPGEAGAGQDGGMLPAPDAAQAGPDAAHPDAAHPDAAQASPDAAHPAVAQAGPGAMGRPGQDGGTQILEVLSRLGAGTLASRMGITVTAASAEQVTGTMPVDGNVQPYGLLHGGASCVLAESLGSVGAALQAGPGRFAVGIEISATHHRAVAHGVVAGVATRVHGGRTTATYEIVISDDRGRRVCSARLTCLLRDQVPPGGHDPGDVAPAGE